MTIFYSARKKIKPIEIKKSNYYLKKLVKSSASVHVSQADNKREN